MTSVRESSSGNRVEKLIWFHYTFILQTLLATTKDIIMLEDIIKRFRNSPRWANSPIARRLGFGSEHPFKEEEEGDQRGMYHIIL
jgi:hypothetical protein